MLATSTLKCLPMRTEFPTKAAYGDLCSISFFLFFFSSSFLSLWLNPWHTEVPRQGLNLSHSCHIHHSCGNAGSFLIHCIGPGSNPGLGSDPSCCNGILNTLAHGGNSPFTFSSMTPCQPELDKEVLKT